MERNEKDKNTDGLLTQNTQSLEQKFDNFTRFVVRKLINLEFQCNDIAKNIKALENRIVENVGNFNVEEEEKESIDIFEYLPLKDEYDLKSTETKLKDNSWYKSQVIHTDATDDEIAAPVKIWLAHAKERLQKGQKETDETHASQ
ncbi:PREDICTED: uncharacterized protein LOC105570725 [Vollenhovia emeryi]|uniref:uncharacterized protein LOC105570725 n=1 Tax=Vollenhovia emeryi TaxID=411798 RepID=UPI0005F4C3EA|nr:PREDICTED: uncharacterized protein LOC105570725 [Vollenhovia emeryi]